MRISRPAVDAIWWRSSGRLTAKSCHMARWNVASSSSSGRRGRRLRQRLARRFGRGGGEQLVAGREVPVDGRHRDAAALRHRRYRQLVERSLGDQLEHGGEHLLAGERSLLVPETHEMIISIEMIISRGDRVDPTRSTFGSPSRRRNRRRSDDEHDVSRLLLGLDVAGRVGGLLQRIGAVDHGPVLAASISSLSRRTLSLVYRGSGIIAFFDPTNLVHSISGTFCEYGPRSVET